MDNATEINSDIYERARLSRDARFDGRFYVGVKTTGIYCRPICPANPPKSENVIFYPTAAAAGEAGFRPCLRCRPECAPGTPAWAGTSTTVQRGLRLIADGALEDGNVECLADRLGVTSRHLRRLFTRHVGASPLAVAHTQRLHFAKRLIDQTSLTMQDISIAAGFGSVRRFNDTFRGLTVERRGSCAVVVSPWCRQGHLLSSFHTGNRTGGPSCSRSLRAGRHPGVELVTERALSADGAHRGSIRRHRCGGSRWCAITDSARSCDGHTVCCCAANAELVRSGCTDR